MQTAEITIPETSNLVKPSPELFFRFFAKVQLRGKRRGGCWTWIGGVSSSGYGMMTVEKKTVKVNRVSWNLFNGSIPDGSGHHGTCVLHKCDNKLCVNPNHLFLGTQKDNMRDMASKGRCKFQNLTKQEVLETTAKRVKNRNWELTSGEKNNRSKLTRLEVEEIRNKFRDGDVSISSLAKAHSVCFGTAAAIIHNKTWRHAG